ncbi:MAG: hypothetical protein ABEI86_07955, partial [Halobacteriaceae archaeon]
YLPNFYRFHTPGADPLIMYHRCVLQEGILFEEWSSTGGTSPNLTWHFPQVLYGTDIGEVPEHQNWKMTAYTEDKMPR